MRECQVCRGAGKVGPIHINYGGGRGEWKDSIPCGDCGGTGEWSEQRWARWDAGRDMRDSRIAAGESIMEAARRLGISPAELSRRERGLLAEPTECDADTISAPSDRLPSSTPPPAQRAAHGGPDERKAEAADLPMVQRAGQAIRGGDDD